MPIKRGDTKENCEGDLQRFQMASFTVLRRNCGSKNVSYSRNTITSQSIITKYCAVFWIKYEKSLHNHFIHARKAIT